MSAFASIPRWAAPKTSRRLILALALFAVPSMLAAQDRPKNDVRLDRFGDPLPAGAVGRLGTVRFRHPHWVNAVVFTPDGSMLASACQDGSARLWDADTGKVIRSLSEAPSGTVSTHMGVAITPDGKTLIEIQRRDGILRAWDLASGKKRWERQEEGGLAFALARDGKTIALSFYGANNVRFSLWDAETGRKIRTFAQADRTFPALAFSPDGEIVAAGEWYGRGIPKKKEDAACSVRLWDVASGRQLHELKGHAGDITGVHFSPDGKLLASSSHDGTIHVWDRAGKLVRVIAVPADPVRLGRFSVTGQTQGADFGGVDALAFSPDGKWIASGGYDGCVRVWDAHTGKALRTMAGHGAEVVSVAFRGDGKVLASASRDHTIRLWDPASGTEIRPREGHSGVVHAIAVSPDGKSAVTACRATSPDGSVHLWTMETGKLERTFRGHTGNAYCVAFSPDARSVASGAQDGIIRIWDTATGRELRQLVGHKETVWSVGFTPVDNMLLSTGIDATFRFWNWSEAKELRKIRADGYNLYLSRDGRFAGTSAEEGRIWEVSTGKELRHIDGRNFALAPDGRSFAAPAAADMIRHWSVVTGEEEFAYPGPKLPPAWPGWPGMVFSPDGRLLAVKNGRTGIELWEIATGKVRRRFTGHQGRIIAFAFAPDGRTLLTGSEDATVLIWDVARQLETPPAQLTAADLNDLMRDLGGDDAERADRAIGTLTARADQSVPFLEKHLKPIPGADPKRLAALIADLDSGPFAVREKAAKDLESMRELATPALKEYLGKTKSLETRRRIEALLASQRTVLKAGELLRSIRAVEVLERIADPDARRITRALAAGAPESRLTQEAKNALSRLK